MIKFYGSLLCPDCVEAQKYFDTIGLKYEFINITESMANLKEFLRLRDSRAEFNTPKKEGYIGIPAVLLESGSIVIDDEVFELNK